MTAKCSFIILVLLQNSIGTSYPHAFNHFETKVKYILLLSVTNFYLILKEKESSATLQGEKSTSESDDDVVGSFFHKVP